jgi:hypothetical protein
MKFSPIKSSALAWVVIVGSSLLLLIALLNLVVNFTKPATYLPLLVVMPFALRVGILSVRDQRRGVSRDRV